MRASLPEKNKTKQCGGGGGGGVNNTKRFFFYKSVGESDLCRDKQSERASE